MCKYDKVTKKLPLINGLLEYIYVSYIIELIIKKIYLVQKQKINNKTEHY
jgi:hypothetical protein